MSVTLNILEVGARGDGIAEENGQRYFVPFTLPGEIVEAEPRDSRGEGIVADLLEVAEHALLRFERQHLAPAGHELGPLDSEHPDVGAAVDCNHPVAEMLPPQGQ